jgi:hypothetical protein
VQDPKVGNPRLWPPKLPFEKTVLDLLLILVAIGFEPQISELFLGLQEPNPPDLMDRVAALVQRLRPPQSAMQQWTGAFELLTRFRAYLNALEEERVPVPDDIPDEFLDECTFELMRNPVKLPKIGDNKQTRVDKSVLPRLGGNDLTGAHYNPEDVEDDLELKARIDAWWREYVDEYRRTHPRGGATAVKD